MGIEATENVVLKKFRLPQLDRILGKVPSAFPLPSSVILASSALVQAPGVLLRVVLLGTALPKPRSESAARQGKRVLKSNMRVVDAPNMIAKYVCVLLYNCGFFLVSQLKILKKKDLSG